MFQEYFTVFNNAAESYLYVIFIFCNAIPLLAEYFYSGNTVTGRYSLEI